MTASRESCQLAPTNVDAIDLSGCSNRVNDDDGGVEAVPASPPAAVECQQWRIGVEVRSEETVHRPKRRFLWQADLTGKGPGVTFSPDVTQRELTLVWELARNVVASKGWIKRSVGADGNIQENIIGGPDQRERTRRFRINQF